MLPKPSYFRVTKIHELRDLSKNRSSVAPVDVIGEGSYHLHSGYVVDGWLLEAPQVGRPLQMLRFRRNGIARLGVFVTSLVIFVGEQEIRTENSIYRFEVRFFE